ncbi:hypothetical protein FLN02_18095 [Pseudomonas aeruginosa]|nr:hypothetical protein FLN02_18095 [Pseudomonas aeruginosa]
MKRIDISGLRYGRLLVVAYDSPGENGGSVWLCRCECGADACAHFGVNVSTAHQRIKAGIPVDIAVRTSGRLAARRERESYLRRDRRGTA